jgi:hypothetical protein
MKKVAVAFYLVLVVLVVVGETKYIIKAFKCNWEPIGKAEIIYTGSALTGLGAVVGWIDIEDK